MDTLILLYALAGSNYIPKGCFIAAWAFFILKVLGNISVKIIEDEKHKRSAFFDMFYSSKRR